MSIEVGRLFNFESLPESLVPWDLVDSDEGLALFTDTVQVTWAECAQEFYDTAYGGRTHGNARTYNEGCRGPLCARAARVAEREKYGREARGQYRWLDPIIEAFQESIERLHVDYLEEVKYAIQNLDLHHKTGEMIAKKLAEPA